MKMLKLQVNDEICLAQLAQMDAGILFNLVNENRHLLREWLPWLDQNTKLMDTQRFIESTLQQSAANTGFVLGIWVGGELAGVIGHNRIDWNNRICYPGYWLAAPFQGKGIMTRSCEALIRHACVELNLNRVDIRCAVGNRRSRAIPERLGFQREGVIRQAEWLYDRYVDHAVYGLLASTDDHCMKEAV